MLAKTTRQNNHLDWELFREEICKNNLEPERFERLLICNPPIYNLIYCPELDAATLFTIISIARNHNFHFKSIKCLEYRRFELNFDWEVDQ